MGHLLLLNRISVRKFLVSSNEVLPCFVAGFDGPKSCWECLRVVYRTKNDARLLMLKDKLANLRMQGPQAEEAFRTVQEIFQQLVSVREAITTKLDAFEGTIATLTENFDVVVQSVNSQNDLHDLKQLAKQLLAESPIDTDTPLPVKKKRGPVYEKILAAERIISPTLRKMGLDTQPHVHYRVPPCNWCGLHGHRMRDCEDLEKEIARRVREYKNQIGPTLPNSSREEPRDNQQSETETATSSLEVPSGKLVLWHKNRFREPLVQEQNTGECGSQRQNVCTELVAGDEMDHSLIEVDVDHLTTPMERSADSTTSRKKMSLVQRRLRTKFMYLLGMNKPSPQVKNHVSRRKTVHKKKSCKELLLFGNFQGR